MQIRLDEWRTATITCDRMEALAMAVPASRCQPSPRSLPEQLPPLEYGHRPGSTPRIAICVNQLIGPRLETRSASNRTT